MMLLTRLVNADTSHTAHNTHTVLTPQTLYSKLTVSSVSPTAPQCSQQRVINQGRLNGQMLMFIVLCKLEGVARYAGLFLAPAEDFGRGLFWPFGQEKGFSYYFVIQISVIFGDQ